MTPTASSQSASPAWSTGAWAAVLAMVGALAALPWTLRYWPSMDGPNHLAIVHILRSLQSPDSPYAPFLRDDLSFGPYQLYYVLLLVLGRVFELHVADKIVQSALLAGFPLSMLWLIRRVAPQRWPAVFLIAPLATGWLAMMGFVNFLLGLILGLPILGLAWSGAGPRGEQGRPPSEEALMLAGALWLASALSHPFAAFFIGVCLLLLEGPRLRRPDTWIRLALVAAPAAVLTAGPMFIRRPGAGSSSFSYGYQAIDTLVLHFFDKSLVSFTHWELVFRLPLLGLMVGALWRARQVGLRGEGREASLARLVVGTLALYVLIPDSIRTALLISPRLSYLFFCTCALLAPLPPGTAHRPLRLCALALLLLLGLLTVQYRVMHRVNQDIEDVVAAGQSIPRGSTVLPLVFDTHGAASRISPLLHSWAHVAMERDLVVPYFFAGVGSSAYGVDEFRPVNFYRPFGPDFLPNLGEYMHRQHKNPGTDDFLKWALRLAPPDVDCSLPVWLGLREDALIAIAHDSYERALVFSPPPGFLERARGVLEVEKQVGKAFVLRPVEGAVPPGRANVCGARP